MFLGNVAFKMWLITTEVWIFTICFYLGQQLLSDLSLQDTLWILLTLQDSSNTAAPVIQSSLWFHFWHLRVKVNVIKCNQRGRVMDESTSVWLLGDSIEGHRIKNLSQPLLNEWLGKTSWATFHKLLRFIRWSPFLSSSKHIRNHGSMALGVQSISVPLSRAEHQGAH